MTIESQLLLCVKNVAICVGLLNVIINSQCPFKENVLRDVHLLHPRFRYTNGRQV